MTRILYDLALGDIDVRPSPFCWLAKFGLLHKGLDFETRPLRFTEKENYPDPEHAKLPILRDGEDLICESAAIIAHLDKIYSEKPIANDDGVRAAASFVNAWIGASVYPALGPMMYVRVHAAAHENDKEYFRTTREERFGATLEELAAKPNLRERLEAALQTLASPLARFKFLGGDEPNLCDYLAFAPFVWQRSVTAEELYQAPQAVDAWIERMLDLYDGYARKAIKSRDD